MHIAEDGKRLSLPAYLRRVRRKALRLSLRSIAALFVFALSGLLASQLFAYLGERSRTERTQRLSSLGEGGEVATGFCPERTTTAVAEVGLHNIDVVTGFISAGVSLCIPPSVLTELRSTGRFGQPIFREVDHRVVVGQRFAHLAMTVQIDGPLTGALRTRVPFTRLAASTLEPRFIDEEPVKDTPSGVELIPTHLFLQNVQLPISGYPEDFPLDSYVVSAQVGISLPSGVTRPTGLTHAYDAASKIPVSVVPTVSPSLRGFAFVTVPEGVEGLYVQARRSAQAILFSFSLALVPVLLVLVLFIVARTTQEAKGLDFLIGSAAILFAVLPIRAVLVPSGLSTLTLIDYLLGWEVGILALVTVWSGTELLTDSPKGQTIQRERGAATATGD